MWMFVAAAVGMGFMFLYLKEWIASPFPFLCAWLMHRTVMEWDRRQATEDVVAALPFMNFDRPQSKSKEKIHAI